jgi:hypothetical protein
VSCHIGARAARQFESDCHTSRIGHRVIVWNGWNTAKIGKTHRDLAAWPLQMRRFGNFSGMAIRDELALQNNPLGMHSSTMILPERTVHRFDQFGRSVNGIVNLRAPVEWFDRCRDAFPER